MKNALRSLVIVGLLMCISQPLNAKIRLPKLISDCLVLQRDVPLKIWGWADVGEKVTIRLDGNYYENFMTIVEYVKEIQREAGIDNA